VTHIERLGIVADTHGSLLPDVVEALARERVGLILHAGDIGSERVLTRLSQVAPVVAVAGNGDESLYHRFPWDLCLTIEGRRILLCHWYDNFGRIHPAIARELEAYRPHALVYGHTHAAVNARRGGCLHFNPGYAGPPGPGRRRSLGRLRLASGSVAGEIVELPADAAR
jgi:putative phosphoesterase